MHDLVRQGSLWRRPDQPTHDRRPRMVKTHDTNSAESASTDLLCESLGMTYRTADGREVEALQDINLDFSKNQLVSFVGPSGCGKTTLLNMIAGFIKPTTGRVLLNGAEIEGPGQDRGMVFQTGALFEWLTVYENVAFGLKINNVPAKECQDRVYEYLDFVGLKNFSNAPIYNLSGGMRQRVAIIRCLVNNPTIMLMDEPLGALDALTREKMQSLIIKLWLETNKLCVFITHSVEEAVYVSSELIVLSSRPGKIVKHYHLPFSTRDYDKPTREVKSSKEFIEVREEILQIIWAMEEETLAHG